jgi:para-nitrobenzyl esterase
MVWIHGGGLVDGRSNDYDGSKLASQGDVIVVSFNYRLNAFGFLAQSALDKEGHLAGNYGLMDQQFALQWVQRNIDKFGGDPNNVTIFGESAGGGSVIANLASPKSEGLFHRGIIESGGYAITSIAPNLDLATAETTGQQFATAVGCADQSAKCLRSLSVEAIIANGSSYMNTANFLEDGKILPQTLYTALKTGQFNRVPVVNGSNRDEMAWFTAIVEAATGHVLTAADYPGALASAGYFGSNVAQVLAEYPLSAYASPSLALSAAETDLVMACSGRIVNQLLSHYVPTYGYEFADRTAPIYFPAPSFPVGAAHTLEIQYLFPLYHGSQGTPEPLNAFQQRLSDTMVDYWTTFAKHGDPNSYRTPTWPVYNPQYDRIESLNLPSPTQNGNFATEHHCDFWDALAEPKS